MGNDDRLGEIANILHDLAIAQKRSQERHDALAERVQFWLATPSSCTIQLKRWKPSRWRTSRVEQTIVLRRLFFGKRRRQATQG